MSDTEIATQNEWELRHRRREVPMDVLMMQTTSPGAAAAADDLRRRGHRVDVCHPDGVAACVALSSGHCPLDRGTIDAAVVVRSGESDAVEGNLERGAYCAIQRGVPLVVGGDPDGDPFAPWAAAEEEGSDLAVTVETVAALPMVGPSVLATHALHAALDKAALPTSHARVEVRRRHGGVVATLFGTEDLSPSQAAMASVRVAAAIRADNGWIRRIDITRDRRRGAQPAAPAASSSSSCS